MVFLHERSRGKIIGLFVLSVHLYWKCTMEVLSSKMIYLFEINNVRQCAISTGKMSSKRLWAMSGGYQLTTWKWKSALVKGQAPLSQHSCCYLGAALTGVSCIAFVLRLKDPDLTSFHTMSEAVAVQKRQKWGVFKILNKACSSFRSEIVCCNSPHCTFQRVVRQKFHQPPKTWARVLVALKPCHSHGTSFVLHKTAK